jgi:hypothetical protein
VATSFFLGKKTDGKTIYDLKHIAAQQGFTAGDADLMRPQGVPVGGKLGVLA